MVSISSDVEFHIRSNTPWPKLPTTVKSVSHCYALFPQSSHITQSLGNAPGLYDKAVFDYSVKNQLRWRNSLGT